MDNDKKIIQTYKAAYRLLDRYSPVDGDCGLMCSAACCMSASGCHDEEMGIYMLPGEDLIHDKNNSRLLWNAESSDEYGFPESWDETFWFVKCSGPSTCDRKMRPLQCRTFPLMPYISEAGELMMIYNDNELPYECPLIENEIPLNDDFVRATRTVWKHLLRDRRIRDMVEQDSELLREALADEEYE